MKKKKKQPRRPAPSPVALQVSEAALRRVALAHNVPLEEVRKQIQLAMLNGLVNGQMDVVPGEGEIPTPEEVVAYGLEETIRRKNK